MRLRFAFLLVMIFSLANFAQATKKALTEKEKIEALIKSVENLKDAKFYRNGDFHSAKDAAEHLRMKWEKAGSKVKTAKDFIDKLASKSSITGEDYKIVYANGKEITTANFFYGELNKLNAAQ
jgi:viroplasmin and RNaseH domain-containing protein